jgi:pyruvate dehydrogenase E2 component (dihydrolipoamide acetyltransferase)
MPRLSDTMTEGVITQWLKHEGDTVQAGDVLAEIETDKATMELEAYDSGTLTRILVQPGRTVPIGETIAVIGEPSGTPVPVPAPESVAAAAPAVAPAPVTPVPDAAGGAIRTSPLARSLARKHGLDLHTVRGSGPGGRIVRADVEAAIAGRPEPAQPAPSTPAPLPAATAPAPLPAATAAAEDVRVPLSSIRRITAQRLTESAAAPHFYLTSVVDAEPLLALRRDLNGALAAQQLKVSVTDLLVKAAAVTLRAHPEVNASWGGDHLIQRAHVNVGIAVALEEGLIVPVVRDADSKSLSEVARDAHALTDRARDGKLTPDEFSGGTFTISNLGMFGIDHFTAVINPPEAAILAVGAARQEAVVRDGVLVPATTMKLTLSIDHRVLDGATAAAFQRDLVGLLEHPLRVLT